MMDKRWVRRFAGLLFVFVCVMLVWRVPVKAATAWDENDIRLIMNQAFENGELEAVVTLERTFSPDEYQAKAEADAYASQMVVYLEDAALKNGKLMNGVSYSYVIIEGREITYRFDISPQFTKEVTVLTSERSAYRQALLALRQRDYKTNFYSEGALYYETFVLALQHHPEYNYNLVIWKGSDGTCGYRPGKELDEGEIRSKMTRSSRRLSKRGWVIRKSCRQSMIIWCATAYMTNRRRARATTIRTRHTAAWCEKRRYVRAMRRRLTFWRSRQASARSRLRERPAAAPMHGIM